MIIKQTNGELYCTVCKRMCDAACWKSKCEHYCICRNCKNYFNDRVCDTCGFTDSKWEDPYEH